MAVHNLSTAREPGHQCAPGLDCSAGGTRMWRSRWACSWRHRRGSASWSPRTAQMRSENSHRRVTTTLTRDFPDLDGAQLLTLRGPCSVRVRIRIRVRVRAAYAVRQGSRTPKLPPTMLVTVLTNPFGAGQAALHGIMAQHAVI